MAKARAIIKRRTSVQNTMKITKTMGMIATANFKRASMRAQAYRPYARAVGRLMRNISASAGEEGGTTNPLLGTGEETDAPEALLVITANRGLCGAYNSHVLSLASKYIEEKKTENISLYVSGKKGITFFKRRSIDPAWENTDIDYIPEWEKVNRLAGEYLGLFAAGKISGLSVVYHDFVSPGTQVVDRQVLLPFTGSKDRERKSAEDEEESVADSVDYIFMPEPSLMLEELIPLSFRITLFKCFLDAGASEQIYRLRAMNGATSAAEKMIKLLTRQYNRARQTQITMELLDIIGGSREM